MTAVFMLLFVFVSVSVSALNLLPSGFFADPDEIPGLAHFLEHLLFMGTEKYPKENEYSQVSQAKSFPPFVS